MPQSILTALERFSDPDDEAQLKVLDDTLTMLCAEDCGPPEFRALLGIFERFPDHDGYGVFWSIVHHLEACRGYEPILIESVRRAPVEFNVLMINRLLNGGITEVDGQSLMSVLADVTSNADASGSTREDAKRLIAYQDAKRA